MARGLKRWNMRSGHRSKEDGEKQGQHQPYAHRHALLPQGGEKGEHGADPEKHQKRDFQLCTGQVGHEL